MAQAQERRGRLLSPECSSCSPPPVGPDLNGDGKPDLVWLNDSTRQAVVWYLGGSQGNVFQGWDWLSSVTSTVGRSSVCATSTATGSLISCGRTMRRSKSSCGIWAALKGTRWMGSNGLAQDGVAGWYVVATGDFNGDGKPGSCGRTTLDKWSCGTWAVPRAILSYGGIGCRQLEYPAGASSALVT